MIDILSLLLFGLLIVYTVFRAIKLDAIIPWFSDESEKHMPPPKRNPPR